VGREVELTRHLLFFHEAVVWVHQASVGLGRIVALCYRSSTSYQIHSHIRYLCFCSDSTTEP
jgi:hypothetical protein